MKIIDAFWEKRNLGVNTLEIEVESSDFIESSTDIKNKILGCIDKDKYQYYVLKFDTSMNELYNIINDLGFVFIETQFDMAIYKTKFTLEKHDDIVRLNKLLVNEYTDEDHFKYVISQINNGLFHTDRIAMDPYFGQNIANLRYANWVNDLIGKDNSALYIASVENEPVGFQVSKYDGSECHALLGGLFQEHQSSGLGVFLHYFNLCKAFEKCDVVKTSLSSNNVNIIKIWQYFSAKMLKMRYVYVKHI